MVARKKLSASDILGVGWGKGKLAESEHLLMGSPFGE